jgi:cyclopropane fatty-acyl-phospholipid synthase-like methyltransferase
VLSEILSRSGYTTDIYDKYFFRKKPCPEDMPKYNIITSTEVFEHIRHPLLILKFLKKLLKPGGIIALMTLFAPDDVDSFKNWWYLRDSTHISFYSINTFTMLAKKTDLKILKTDNKNICTLAKKTNVLY